mgnify:CR=1 FL=1
MGGARVAHFTGVFTIGSLILGTVLTGPAARPVTETPSELANPFENAPAAVDTLDLTSTSRGGELLDPFAPTPTAIAPAKRRTVRAPSPPAAQATGRATTPPSADLRDPWAPVRASEAAAQRIEPRAKAGEDLHAPFPTAKPRSMTTERARQIEAGADLHNPFE